MATGGAACLAGVLVWQLAQYALVAGDCCVLQRVVVLLDTRRGLCICSHTLSRCLSLSLFCRSSSQALWSCVERPLCLYEQVTLPREITEMAAVHCYL